jgi:hypothetical protein
MALHPGESGSRGLRQGVERLAVPVRVQRGTIIVGQTLCLPGRAFPIHISAWQAMRLPYNYCSSPRRITSSLHLRLSKWVVTDRRLHKSDRSPASAKRRYYDQPSVARPVIPEANPTRVRRDTLLQRQNRH